MTNPTYPEQVYEQMSEVEYELGRRTYPQSVEYILGRLTGQPQNEEQNQQFLEAKTAIIQLAMKSIGKDETVDSTENHLYGPKSVRNRLRADLRQKWESEE